MDFPRLPTVPGASAAGLGSVLSAGPAATLHAIAKDIAIELDGAFFGLHPDRCFHARPSIAGEIEGWGVFTHLEQSWMLVKVDRVDGPEKFSSYERIGLTLGNMSFVPDDEEFLSAVWDIRDAGRAEAAARGDTYLHAPAEIGKLFNDWKARKAANDG